MPVRYDKLVPTLKTVLCDDTLSSLGRAVAFIRRLREIQAGPFVWSVVLSRFGSGRPGFEQARQWYQRLCGSRIWRRPFQIRFKNERAVKLFEQAFETVVSPWRSATRRCHHPLARYFADVVVCDSTLVQVADSLKKIFRGTRQAKAALKVNLGISLFGLVPLFARIVAASRSDMVLFPALELFRPGTLLLFDKGFGSYDQLRATKNAGHHFLTPLRSNGNPLIVGVHAAPRYVRKALLKNPEGVLLRELLPAQKRLGRVWDLQVLVQPQAKPADLTPFCTRLVIVPGLHGSQRPYVTNLEVAAWKADALAELYRLRWQVELVFKELKQHLHLETLPSTDRHAVQILVWASLIALALSRCIAAWLQPAPHAGLSSPIRHHLVTRALRGSIRLLGRAIIAPPRRASLYVGLLADDLMREALHDPDREDSFKRLELVLVAA
jgi:putative transposase